MSDDASLLWLEVEGFRGFNERQRIELDASALVVVGPNGTGKTSFFDAVQWLLLGSLQRLERWRVRKNVEHIVNRYRGSEPAVVEAELNIRGERVRLRRQGRYDSGLLEWHGDDGVVHGDEAQQRLSRALTPRPDQDFRRLMMSSALLQQDVVREVLEDKPSERYQHLAALLGLDQLGYFEAAVRKRADRFADAGKEARTTLEGAQDRVERLEARIQATERDVQLADDVAAVRSDVVRRLQARRAVVEVARVPATSAEAALLHDAADVAVDRVYSYLRESVALANRRQGLSPASAEEVEEARARAVAAERGVDEAERALAAAEAQLAAASNRSSQLSELAVQALDLLGPTCPVCGQDIDETHVRHELTERIQGASAGELAALHDQVESARQAVTRTTAEYSQRERELADVLAGVNEVEQVARAERQLKEHIAAFIEGKPFRLQEPTAIVSGDIRAGERAVEALRAISAAARDLMAVLRSDAGDRRLTELRAELRRAEEAVAPLREAARLASEQEENAKVLQRAATRAVTAVTQKRFKRLLPTVQDIYWRLDPHPSFTTFDFDLDVYRQRGIASPIVRDEVGAVEGDPLLVFSSSQANVAALSYFLALGWAAGPDALPFVLLDDPLQSMDDVNALGFADLCRHIRGQRQLVVSTHEQRLGALLQRKLTPRVPGQRTRVLEFKAWTRHGPVLEQSVVPPQLSEGAHRSLVPAGAA